MLSPKFKFNHAYNIDDFCLVRLPAESELQIRGATGPIRSPIISISFNMYNFRIQFGVPKNFY